MVDFVIRVITDPSPAKRGAQGVRTELRRTERSADRLGKTIARAFALLGGIAAVRGVVRLADAFTVLQNRLRVVTNSTRELNQVTRQLLGVANRTRASLESTVTVFSRTALATKALGLSQAETMRFTESLNQAVIISGASAQEAGAALIQLSQGLASGALRGDELRSVLEQLPVVADVIAKELGVTRGRLREMGSEGLLTSDIIIRAFRNAREELADRFAKTIPTISQSFTILRNNLILTLGQFLSANGVLQRFSAVIRLVAGNLDALGSALVIVAKVLAGPAIVLGAQAITRALGALSAAVLALAARTLPLLAAAGTVAFATLAIVAAKNGKSVKQTFDELKDSVERLFGSFTSGKGAILSVKAGLGEIGNDLNKLGGITNLSADQLESFVARISALRNQVSNQSLISQIVGGTEADQKFLVEFLSDIDKLLLRFQTRLLELNGTNPGSGLTTPITSSLQKEIDAANEFSSQLKLQNELIRAQLSGNQALSRELEIQLQLQSSLGSEVLATQPAIVEGIRRQLEEQQSLNNALERQEELRALGEEVGAALSDSFRQAVLDGESLSKTLSNLARRLADIVLQAALFKPIEQGIGNLFAGQSSGFNLGSLLGGGGGNVFGSAGPASIIPGFASGGSFQIAGNGGVDRNVLSVNNIPVVNVSKGEKVSVNPTGNTGTIVQIINNTGQPAEERRSTLPDGRELIQAVIGAPEFGDAVDARVRTGTAGPIGR